MIILLLIAFVVAEECVCQCAGIGFGGLHFNQSTVDSCKSCTAAYCQTDPDCQGLTSTQCLDEVPSWTGVYHFEGSCDNKAVVSCCCLDGPFHPNNPGPLFVTQQANKYTLTAERGSGCPSIQETITADAENPTAFLFLPQTQMYFYLGDKGLITMVGINGTCLTRGLKKGQNVDTSLVIGIILVVLLALIIAVLSHFFWQANQKKYQTIQSAKITYGHSTNL